MSDKRTNSAQRLDVQVNPEMDSAIERLQAVYAKKGISLSKSATIRMAVIQCASGVSLGAPAEAA